jgi:hypothetical protein
MKLANNWIKKGLLLTLGILGIAAGEISSAQVETKKVTTTGQSSQVVKVERGEVVAVQGNELIVRMADGSIRHFPNVPEAVKVTVEGKQLGIHDLKPGMKLQRTITTTTTPQTVTTIQTVTGKIWYVAPPNSLILTMENGTNQQFKIPPDQKFKVDGKMVDAFALRKGMQVSATKIVEVPVEITTRQKSVTGTMPEPPPTPPADAALLIAEGDPTPTPPAPPSTETPAAPANPVPETGSYLPWVVLVALLLIVLLLAIRYIRAKSSK